MAGEVTYTLSEADLLAAYREPFRRWLFNRQVVVGHVVFLIVLVAIAIAIHPDCYCRPISERVLDELRSIWPFAVAIALWYGFCYAFTVPWRARRSYREMTFLRRPTQFAWSDDGIVQQTTHGTGTYAWEDLKCWNDLASNILIYYGDRPGFIIPRRALTDAQSSDLTATLTASPLARA